MGVTCKIPLNVAQSPQADTRARVIQSLIDKAKGRSALKHALAGPVRTAVLAMRADQGFEATRTWCPWPRCRHCGGHSPVMLRVAEGGQARQGSRPGRRDAQRCEAERLAGRSESASMRRLRIGGRAHAEQIQAGEIRARLATRAIAGTDRRGRRRPRGQVLSTRKAVKPCARSRAEAAMAVWRAAELARDELEERSSSCLIRRAPREKRSSPPRRPAGRDRVVPRSRPPWRAKGRCARARYCT